MSSLADYIEKCDKFEPKELQLDALQGLLIARDSLAADAIHYSSEDRKRLRDADKKLQETASKSNQIRSDCNELRQSLKPLEAVWWWNLDKIEAFEPKWTIICTIASAILFSLTFTIFTDITSRFVNGPLDQGSISALVLQALLTIGAGSTLTSWAKTWLRSVWKSIGFSADASFLAAPVAALALFCMASGFKLMMPIFASNYAKGATSQGSIDASISLLKKAVALDPDSASHQLELGRRLERRGDSDGAITALSEAIKLDSKNNRAQLDLAHAYLSKEPPDYIKAGNLLLHQIPDEVRRSPDATTRALFHSHTAWLLLGQGRTPEAIGSAQIALQAKELAETHAILASIYQSKADDRADSHWKKALDLMYSDSDNPPAYRWQEEIALNNARLGK